MAAQKGAHNQDIYGRGQNGVPLSFVVTDGVVADCTKAAELIENTGARGLIADKGYDSDKILRFAEESGIKLVIPPRINRKNSNFMIKIPIKQGIWSKMLFYSSNVGGV